MDGDLLLALMEQQGGATPPLVLAVDARPSGSARTAKINFRSDVAGWTPLIGDADAGFQTCKKLVLGPAAQLKLLPGEGELLAISMYSAGGY